MSQGDDDGTVPDGEISPAKPTPAKRPAITRRALGWLSAGLATARRGRAEVPPEAKAYLADPVFQPHAGPRGKVERFFIDESSLYPGYRHWCAVYRPDPQVISREPALMVFQDGQSFAAAKGPWRTPDVLDNLIASGTLPPMIAVFVSPGFNPNLVAGSKPARDTANHQRSVEYDTLSTAYSDFLMNEVLPRAAAYGKWSSDPNLHGIGGHSSGAICAFTVAWHRPDMFRKVYSANGSFTNIRGGDKYPTIVAATPKRPLRVYQWSDTNDMSRPDWGDWASANKAMAAALSAAGYDHRFDFGEGSHNPVYAAARFPGALKWLWRT
jgi:enterochelin esterase family protein